jgi:hypothetical protein
MVGHASTPHFSAFSVGMRAALSRGMKTHVALASIAALTLLTSAARADESDMVKPPSRAAHTAGVALTITGASFLGTGLVAGIGGVALGITAGGDNGFGAIVIAAFGGMIAAGCTVVGLSTLIPGIVLMNNNRLPHYVAPPPPAFQDARNHPAPTFTSIPILSGTF